MAQQLGDIVQLVGLKSREDLNGTYAVVIEPDSPEEALQLRDSGRVKVTAYPKTLSLKPDNLQVATDEELGALDWSFMDGNFPGTDCQPTVYFLVSHPTFFLGDIYKFAELADHLWAMVAKGIPVPPKRHLADMERLAMLNNTAAHSLYFLSLDQIAHHMIIETRAGLCRVYQCYVESMMDENGDSFGYSAREWITGKPDDPAEPLAAGVIEAQKRWGGADFVKRHVLQALLDLIYQLKDSAIQLAGVMYEQLPSSVKEVESVFQEQRTACQVKGKPMNPPKGGLLSWSQEILNNPQCLMHTAPNAIDERTTITSNDKYTGELFEFSLPKAVTDPFETAYFELIGFKPQAPVFITVIHHFYCEDMGKADPLTGTVGALGWGLRAAAIPH